MLDSFPRAMLGDWPTPLHHLANYGSWLGHPHFYMKRDDLATFAMGGNKVRSLEFQIGEALELGADTIIAAGGLQSNQCRLAVAAAIKHGLAALPVHNAPRPPEPWQGNMLLHKLMGAKSMFLGPVSESARESRVRMIEANLQAEGKRPDVVEQNARGALGYVSAVAELAAQSAALANQLKHVVIVGAMGGTAAGFIFGVALLKAPFKVHVISVEYDLPVLRDIVTALCDELARLTGSAPQLLLDEVAAFYGDYMGPGYGVSTPQSIQAIYDLAQREAIFVENVYNSKTLWGAADLVRRGVIPKDEAVCVINTGGTPAFFTQSFEI
ncbi:MAG TPA: pyridoxal-phosphate dependent enzyme [Bacillota bacterium]|nr:pyridoxal-phosphate dependent enzyme [Bacillota bacterium]